MKLECHRPRCKLVPSWTNPCTLSTGILGGGPSKDTEDHKCFNYTYFIHPPPQKKKAQMQNYHYLIHPLKKLHVTQQKLRLFCQRERFPVSFHAVGRMEPERSGRCPGFVRIWRWSCEGTSSLVIRWYFASGDGDPSEIGLGPQAPPPKKRMGF